MVGEEQAGLELQKARQACDVSVSIQSTRNAAHPVKTGIEAELRLEWPFYKLVILAVYTQQGLHICFRVLPLSDNSTDRLIPVAYKNFRFACVCDRAGRRQHLFDRSQSRLLDMLLEFASQILQSVRDAR